MAFKLTANFKFSSMRFFISLLLSVACHGYGCVDNENQGKPSEAKIVTAKANNPDKSEKN